jgi:predicted regulator of Ras-like GTPase activity (Roadblock/LC7/MglB family)
VSLEHTQLQVQEALDAFVRESHAVGVQLCERSGASLAISGDLFRVDPSRFAASLAGVMASAQGMMRPLGKDQVRSLHIDAGEVKLLTALVKPGFSVVVVFDARSSLGVVRWRLASLVDRLSSLLGAGERQRIGSPITDEEIENLFS